MLRLIVLLLASLFSALPAVADMTADCAQLDNLELSIKACSLLIDANKNNPTVLEMAYLNRGAAFGDTRRLAFETWVTHGRAYIDKNRKYELATADFSKAINIDTKLTLAYIFRGVTYEITGDRVRAIADYKTGLGNEPSNKQLRSGLSRLGLDPRTIIKEMGLDGPPKPPSDAIDECLGGC